MISPQGLTLFSTLYRGLVQRDRLSARTALERSLKLRGETDAEAMLPWFYGDLPADVVESRMFAEMPAEIELVSPDLRRVRLDFAQMREALSRWVFQTTELHDGEGWHRLPPERVQVMEHRFRLFTWSPESLLHGHGIDNDEWRRSPWRWAEKLESADLHQRIPLFHERQGFTIDVSTFADRMTLGSPDAETLRDVVQRLEPQQGWALAVEARALKGIPYFTRSAPANYGEETEAAETAKGRPRKIEQALKVYQSEFPAGNGALTWNQIASRILEVSGISVSSRTLQRAVADAEQPVALTEPPV